MQEIDSSALIVQTKGGLNAMMKMSTRSSFNLLSTSAFPSSSIGVPRFNSRSFLQQKKDEEDFLSSPSLRNLISI